MIIRELTINNKSGLHARPAALWVQAASRYLSTVRLKKAEREVDGKSLLGLLSLGIAAGSTVQLSVDGSDEQEAIEGLEKFIADLAAREE